MSPRYFRNTFDDYRDEYEGQLESELENIKQTLQSKGYFLSYLDQIDRSYPLNDVYAGKYGVLLLYFFLYKKNPDQFKQRLLNFYSNCISKDDERCHSLISFHCGSAGIYSIESVIQQLIFNNQQKRDESLSKLAYCVQNALNSKNYDELLYGRVSLLYALCFVENELKNVININELSNAIQIEDSKRRLVQKILQSGLEGRNQLNNPLLAYHYSWHGKEYCGAAHGYSGIYYLLLKNRIYCTEAQLDDLIMSSLTLIESQLLSNGNMTSKLNGGNNDLVQFCHGSPGFMFLISELYAVCEETNKFNKFVPQIREIADRCLNNIWNYGILTKGLNLCHGVAGNAYAFLAYAKTGDKKSLFRAIQFAKYCLKFDESFMLSDRPLSLYEGLAGTIYFLVDLLEPNQSLFPGFELN